MPQNSSSLSPLPNSPTDLIFLVFFTLTPSKLDDNSPGHRSPGSYIFLQHTENITSPYSAFVMAYEKFGFDSLAGTQIFLSTN